MFSVVCSFFISKILFTKTWPPEIACKKSRSVIFLKFYYLYYLIHFFLVRSIDDQFHVKLTDMALSRDFFPNDYHCLGDNENRPIKWMAIESLTRREFSTASDIVNKLITTADKKSIHNNFFTSVGFWRRLMGGNNSCSTAVCRN